MRYRTKQRFTEIVIVRDNKLQRAITLQEGDELRFAEEGFEPLIDTPEQEEHHTQECECDRSFSGEKLPGFYCCCKDPIFNLKREQPTKDCEKRGWHYFYTDVVAKKTWCLTCGENLQPTKEIEPLQPWDLGLGLDYYTIKILDKLNELVAAVNALQKGNEG